MSNTQTLDSLLESLRQACRTTWDQVVASGVYGDHGHIERLCAHGVELGIHDDSEFLRYSIGHCLSPAIGFARFQMADGEVPSRDYWDQRTDQAIEDLRTRLTAQ